MGFSMTPLKEGRLKYLLLALGPSFAISQVSLWLTERGVLPQTDLVGILVMLVSMGITFLLGYALVFRKNHIIEVSDLSVAEKDWQGKCRVIPRGRIRGYRRNWLKEILLLDEDGKTLLCVESNMENRGRFENWLASHHIPEKQ